MLPHQERIVQGRDELLDKLKKLHSFFDSLTFLTLTVDEQGRLKKQSEIMLDCISILNERIASF